MPIHDAADAGRGRPGHVPRAPTSTWLAEPLALQDGVVTRAQILALGGDDGDIARMVRRRELTTRHRGVYVVHTGPLTQRQREWVAVLACWPAALARESALPPEVAGRSRPSEVVHVLVGAHRTRQAPAWVRTHRTGHLDDLVDWHRSPPRQRLVEAVLDVCIAQRSAARRFTVLAEACRLRLTTPDRIRAALDARSRVPDRRLLVGLVEDLAAGANSVLERGYLHLERSHGLPTADRQRRERLADGWIYRDAPYLDFGVVVELDGRPHHDTARGRDRDADRDLETLVRDLRGGPAAPGSGDGTVVTVRLTTGQVLDRGCATVARVALLLMSRGWAGPFVPCPECAD